MILTNERMLASAAVLLLYALLCAAVWWRHQRRLANARQAVEGLASSADGHAPVLVAYASQTGRAEELAWQTAQALGTAGVPARVMPLSELSADTLHQAARALFLVSTYGEGDPPDNGALFAQRVMGSAQAADLSGLRYAVLALGDTDYQHYCGFGRALDAWLSSQGAQAWGERIEVDDGHPEALARWRQQLSHIAGVSDWSGWESAPFERWTLAAREHLNPGSLGQATYHLELAPPPGNTAQWEAGDLVQISAPAAPDHPREYSIASLPADGRVHLLVRQARLSDGRLGVASGWLTEQLPLGAEVPVRLRAHRNFRAEGQHERPWILIGNGTGLAGLRAHLKARAALRPSPASWLVFGERQSTHDFYYRQELEQWTQAGWLRLDTVFSREPGPHRYVQDVLRAEQSRVRDWVGRGAAIYVCGSLEGMAGGVHEALREVLGASALEALIEQGRYRRDVY